MLCGIDEAGRGPLAGPVCAAAVVLPEDFPVDILNDSKKLNEKQREQARLIITDKAIAWAVAWATHIEIDEINILQASLLAMQRAVQYILKNEELEIRNEKWEDYCLLADHDGDKQSFHTRSLIPKSSCGYSRTLTPNYLMLPFGKPLNTLPKNLNAIVDGLHVPTIPIPCTAMVKADAKVPQVMAASILAKTARDQLMVHYSKIYPDYGYERHKGYPTVLHKQLIRQFGPSPIARKSFKI